MTNDEAKALARAKERAAVAAHAGEVIEQLSAGMGMYFNRAGEPISQAAWHQLWADKDYQILTQLKEERDDGMHVLISTVWLGLNHRWGTGPPLIFETMTFVSTPDSRAAREWSRENMRETVEAIQLNHEPPKSPFPEGREHPFDQRCYRWSSEDEALEGHEIVVQAFRENLDPDKLIDAYHENKRREAMI